MRDDSAVAGEDYDTHPSRLVKTYVDAAYKAVMANRRLNNGSDNFLNKAALPTIMNPGTIEQRVPGDMWKARLVVDGWKIIKEDGT